MTPNATQSVAEVHAILGSILGVNPGDLVAHVVIGRTSDGRILTAHSFNQFSDEHWPLVGALGEAIGYIAHTRTQPSGGRKAEGSGR